MARPRLYHTAEERKAANRAKSKRHYHKDKSAIQERRRGGFKGQGCCQNSDPKTDSTGSTVDKNEDLTRAILRRSSPLAYWLGRVERLGTKLTAFFGDLPRRQYVDNIVEMFMATGEKDLFRNEIVKLGNLQRFAQRYEAEILQLAGIGKEFEKVSALERDISAVIHWFEELICQAMVDMPEFTKIYFKSGYQYQM